jgi:hypothetical protein
MDRRVGVGVAVGVGVGVGVPLAVGVAEGAVVVGVGVGVGVKAALLAATVKRQDIIETSPSLVRQGSALRPLARVQLGSPTATA